MKQLVELQKFVSHIVAVFKVSQQKTYDRDL